MRIVRILCCSGCDCSEYEQEYRYCMHPKATPEPMTVPTTLPAEDTPKWCPLETLNVDEYRRALAKVIFYLRDHMPLDRQGIDLIDELDRLRNKNK